MNSLRIKIVLSLIGMSIFSIALGGFSSRAVLERRFEDVVAVRSSEEFSRDLLGYYRDHGSFEEAHKEESWSSFLARRNLTRLQQNTPGETSDAARFIGTDIQGKVWAPAGNFSLGDIVSGRQLQDAIPVINNGTQIGYVVVEGQLQLSGTEAQYLTALTNSLWLSLFGVALVAIPLGFFLGNRLTDPINNLIGAIRAMRPKTMYQSVPITSRDEIGLLSQSFNQMSEELASFVEVTEQQKEKIADTEVIRKQALVSISHELRTPLYRLVSQAYAMLDGIRAIDRDEMTKVADSLDHLTKLVDDLYELSLSDVHTLKCDIAPTDFSMIVRKAVEARKEIFASRGFTLRQTVPEELVVQGDATRLRQIVENLLSNCIRYTEQDGEVQVELSVSDEFAELVVSDSGPGVPSECLESLFDRFFRIESSRSRTTGGTGLGLSLVKTFAEIHDGNAEAYVADQGGLAVRVRIPVKSSTT